MGSIFNRHITDIAERPRRRRASAWTGWREISTGGGATALYRSFAKGYWLVTDVHGMRVPLKRARLVLLGCYDAEGVCSQDWTTTPSGARAIVDVMEGR